MPAVDFPIVWADPDDEDLTWERDDMHMPFAVSPLSADYIQILFDGMPYGREKVQNPWRWHVRFLNGYVYMAARETRPVPDEAAAIKVIEEHQRALIPTTAAYWWERAIPELHGVRDWFRRADVATAGLATVADLWVDGWRRAERAWQIHFFVIRAAYQVADDLADFYERVVPDAAPGQALRLIQGWASELQEADRGLDRLAELVDANRDLRAAFGDGPPSLAALSALPEAADFLDALDIFLAEHGHLGGSFDDLAFPSWSEEPDIILGDVARRLAAGGPSSEQRHAALLAEADAMADDVRRRLAGQPEELERFEWLLDHARSVGPLTEIHNYWIDRMVQSLLRTFAMRVGARLADAGVVDAPEDVLYLRRAGVADLLREPANRQDWITERRMTHEQQKAMVAPRHVGRPPEQPSEPDRFDGARFVPADDGTLRGTGASGGTYRGTARVVLGPADFGKVERGDVIVAPSSNPSWLPLFSIAGGLLTNTGGVACHAAVVAREFGLPAVVGLGDATTRIPDGATVELEGTTGYVRIL
jgi:pyruvate,water dikinase